MFRRICQEKVSLKSSTWGIMNPFVVQLFLAASVKSFMTYPSTKNKNVAYKKYLRISLFLIWMRHLFLRGESRLLVIHNYIKLLRADCVASVEITENGLGVTPNGGHKVKHLFRRWSTFGHNIKADETFDDGRRIFT